MELNSLHIAVLDVLAHQTEGYLCNPDAAAFVAMGLDDSERVLTALHDLQDAEYVEFYIEYVQNEVVQLKLMSNDMPERDEDDNVIPLRDEDGTPLTKIIEIPVDEGWIITAIGKTAFNSV